MSTVTPQPIVRVQRALVCALVTAVGLATACATPDFVDLELPPGAAPGSPPVEAFFGDGGLEQPQLSPSGRYVAGFKVIRGKRNIVRIDLETGASNAVTAFDGTDIYRFWWATENRILFNAAFRGGQVRRLAAIDADGTGLVDFAQRKDPRGLVPVAASLQLGDEIVSLLPDDPDHILVAYGYSPTALTFASDVYKLNIRTGRAAAVVHSDAHPRAWLADPSGVVRLGYGASQQGVFFVYRKDAESEWVTIREPQNIRAEPLGFLPLGFTEEPDEIYVLARNGGDRLALHRYNVAHGTLSDLVFAHPRVDVGGPLVYATPQPGQPARVLGVHYTTDYPQIHWLDPDAEALTTDLRRSLPGVEPIVRSRSADGSRLLVLAASDRVPPTYYLMEPAKRAAMRLFSTRPDLDPDVLAEVKPVSYTARDGVEIPGYLTLPRGSEGRRVPIIVNPHGGPAARDTRFFSSEVQFLASRGWGVFQPNFRGSSGFGRQFEMIGYREWGLAMQDDITDGVRWLIQQGIADPERICIYGGSYGGYAAMVGVTKTPELYACGATLAGVSDLDDLLSDVAFYLNAFYLDERLGRRGPDAERLRATSPITNIEAVRVPILIAHGVEDRVVRVAQSTSLADALEGAEKPHHLMLFQGQPHGFIDEDQRIRYYRNLEAFFYRHLGPGVRASVDSAVGADGR